jgi:uracil-DNA glycosylase family 4
MNNLFACPVCGNEKGVPPAGSSKSSILVVAEFPGKDEIIKGRPMVGKTGMVLSQELGRLGLDINQMRICNLWQHEPNNNPGCRNYGLEVVIKEAKGKQAILLLGSETVATLTNEKISNVCGLNLKSNYLSAPIIIACVNPAQAFHSNLGEMRLALKKFAQAIEGII